VTDSSLQPRTTSWAAPLADGAITGTVRVPGSKSQTNRVLVLAALADAPVVIRNPLIARDTELMAAALTALGSAVITASPHEWAVAPGVLAGGVDIDCGLAGTVMRFLPPVAALAVGTTNFDGDLRARERPMAGLLDALRTVGVRIEDNGRGALPFRILGTGSVKGGTCTIDASASSQFVSGLLLSGARFDEGLVVRHVGEQLPSLPHIDMTIATLADFGLGAARIAPAAWQVEPGMPTGGGEYVIEPDLSNAAPFLAAAVATGGSVLVPDWPSETSQPGDEIRNLLVAMGGSVELTQAGLTVRGTGVVRGITADLGGFSELATTIAALAVFADSPTTITGVAHMRGHETDRLAGLVAEITGLGGDAEETSDGLIIKPRPLHGGTWRSYADHRMATAGAVIGLLVADVEVDDIESTSKTMPGFASLWSDLVAGVVPA
jgi:3-phosphoshikimate 1-carboxyvinyltransferase